MDNLTYPKRLIEVDLPIFRISAHSRREKSIRHGHISTLHMWWARRPLAACRAVVCASLWPDPADPLCPQSFRDEAARVINAFAKKADSNLQLLSTSSEGAKARWAKLAKPKGAIDPSKQKHLVELRAALFDFIADFANWDNSTVKEYLETSRALTRSAHEALGGVPGTRPLVVDPFAGGGSIPLEALRVGADAFSSDLNPVAVLLNKVVLTYIPQYGQRLADEVRRYGNLVQELAEKRLADAYPRDPDGSIPIVFHWARTIACEGPGCGAEVPLTRSLWLCKKSDRRVALKLSPHPRKKSVVIEIVNNVAPKDVGAPTIKRGSATCPCCGYTTSDANVRKQFQGRSGGVNDARLVAVVVRHPSAPGRSYRKPTERDEKIIATAKARLSELQSRLQKETGLSGVPSESLPYLRSIFNINLLDVTSWGGLFSPRQLLVATTLVDIVLALCSQIDLDDAGLRTAVITCMALAVDRHIDQQTSLVAWLPTIEAVSHTFVRQALAISWDFCEPNPISEVSGGNISGAFEWIYRVIEAEAKSHNHSATVALASATQHPLPDDSAATVFTDPPYYDAVPYADLSDFFYVWLKRMLGKLHPDLFSSELTPKNGEIVQLAERNQDYAYKTKEYFEAQMTLALCEGRRVCTPTGLGVFVFAHKETRAWETMLSAVIGAGWVVTASWPIDTERTVRLRAMNSAALGSSVHLVCRPRENSDGTIRTNEVGDWRDVLAELPRRIHEWMPRLAEEGVVGADAIFACLGPALEVFSRYSRVEKASGDVVPLKEYLEQVWAAVSTEALSMIFQDADAAGLEPDARLTAMWMWTLGGGTTAGGNSVVDDDSSTEVDEEESSGGKAPKGGYVLEFDAARKIAQGLGVHLERIDSVVEVKGDKARLRAVAERTSHLFGKGEEAPAATKKKKKPAQKSLFEELDEVVATDAAWGEIKGPSLGETVLDRVHQSMILFAAGRSEAMKRFLVEDGAGKDARFWKLAQSLSALYPKDTDEKRWVDGVLARKKGLGL